MRTIKMLLCLVTLAAFGAAVSGCHTTEGFGKDMEAGGRKIKNEAHEHND